MKEKLWKEKEVTKENIIEFIRVLENISSPIKEVYFTEKNVEVTKIK